MTHIQTDTSRADIRSQKNETEANIRQIKLASKTPFKKKKKTNLKLSSANQLKINTYFKGIRGTGGAKEGRLGTSNSNKLNCLTLTNPKGPDPDPDKGPGDLAQTDEE